ncbi:MAG TPA: dTMP kinase [Oleiagrimonas sp.]|nr:dTMP kinase [Oleiagrimonas sp.]
MNEGFFITLEGGEGAGKSTLLEGLRAHLASRGIDPVLTREPGGTHLGECVRALVLGPEHGEVCAESELLLMFAARAQLVREVLQPALDAGRCVLCDRFADASYAYQGGGRGQPVERIAALEQWAVDGLTPDLTLLLDLSVDTGRSRIAGRTESDRIEGETDAFFERVRKAYQARAAAEPQRFCLIDASQSADQVLAQAVAAIDCLIEVRRA